MHNNKRAHTFTNNGRQKSVSMRTAKRLHKYLNIDAKVLIEYA